MTSVEALFRKDGSVSTNPDFYKVAHKNFSEVLLGVPNVSDVKSLQSGEIYSFGYYLARAGNIAFKFKYQGVESEANFCDLTGNCTIVFLDREFADWWPKCNRLSVYPAKNSVELEAMLKEMLHILVEL